MTPYEKRRDKRRIFLVRFGVYLVILAGVLFQAGVVGIDFKRLTIEFVDFSTWGLMTVVVAAIGAAFVYREINKSRKDEIAEDVVKRKMKHLGTVLWYAFTAGVSVVAIVEKVLGGLG